jgi:hypothetical protein
MVIKRLGAACAGPCGGGCGGEGGVDGANVVGGCGGHECNVVGSVKLRDTADVTTAGGVYKRRTQQQPSTRLCMDADRDRQSSRSVQIPALHSNRYVSPLQPSTTPRSRYKELVMITTQT